MADRTSKRTSVWWRGIAVGLVAAMLVFVMVVGLVFRSGYGVVLDTVAAMLFGVLGLIVFALVTIALVWVLRRVPTPALVAGGAVLGTVFGVRLLDEAIAGRALWPEEIYYSSLLAFLALHGLSGGAVATLMERVAQPQPRTQKLAWLVVVVVVTIDVAAVVWFLREGRVPDEVMATSLDAGDVPRLSAPDPARRGPYDVRSLTYGTPPNRRRPALGANADLQTEPVDASPLLREWRGFRQRMRERYWGFGIDQYPINGTVWYPDGVGPFPLVLVVHGNHAMEEYSDPGYGYLGDLLASRGYIVASVDENLTNATWSGDFGGREMPIRAWVLLRHLRQWREWNADGDTPFRGNVDMGNIALIGHSRGGEAVAMASVFNHLPFFPDNAMVPLDTGFAIQAVVGIAPTDYRYSRRLTLENVSYMTLHGAYDTDVSSFFGMRQYDRVRFTDDAYRIKFAFYIHRANHGQFNTVWGREDLSPPRSWLLNTAPLLPAEDQRRIASTYISAFLEFTLRDNVDYLPMFRDPRVAAHWLPETGYVHRFEDSALRVIANFEEDLDVTTTTLPAGRVHTAKLAVWREQPLAFRSDEANQINSGVHLGWTRADADTSVYALGLSPQTRLSVASDALLSFALAVTDEDVLNGGESVTENDRPEERVEPVTVVVEVRDQSGTAASVDVREVGPVAPPFHTPLLLKTQGLSDEAYDDTWEPVLKTYEIPFGEFIEVNPRLQLASLTEIRFLFPRERDAVVILDDVGVRAGRPLRE